MSAPKSKRGPSTYPHGVVLAAGRARKLHLGQRGEMRGELYYFVPEGDRRRKVMLLSTQIIYRDPSEVARACKPGKVRNSQGRCAKPHHSRGKTEWDRIRSKHLRQADLKGLDAAERQRRFKMAIAAAKKEYAAQKAGGAPAKAAAKPKKSSSKKRSNKKARRRSKKAKQPRK